MNYRLLLIILVFSIGNASAQYTTDKVVGPKNKNLIDSIKKEEYPYLFPIWGQKVVAKGFKIPKSGGLSAQYLFQQSDIIIHDLQVGFNNGPQYNLDEIIRFNSAIATSNGINIRPDVWLFPFLNIYGILAKSKTSTAIDAGVWIPDSTGFKQVGSFKTKANFDATTYGFGMTPTFGIGGFFMALDMNVTWSDISALEKPAFIFILGPRIGKNITLKNPNRNIAFWTGGFRVHMGSTTTGNLNASDLFPIDQWESKVNDGYTKLSSAQGSVDQWWNDLTPAEQKNPVNIAKHETAGRVLTTYGRVLDGASQIISGAGDASIQYSLSKKPKDMWNFLLGSQFQLNRSLMFRVECGFLSSRTQIIAGIQYRFDF